MSNTLKIVLILTFVIWGVLFKKIKVWMRTF